MATSQKTDKNNSHMTIQTRSMMIHIH